MLKLSEDTETLFGDLFTNTVWDGEEVPHCLKDFIYFIDNYASKVVGLRDIAKFYRENKKKTLLDQLTVSDIAYAVLVYENTVHVWEENEEMRARLGAAADDQSGKAEQKYHIKKGTRLPVFVSGWTDEGVAYLCELVKKINKLWSDKAFMDRLRGDWDEYAHTTKRYSFRKVTAECPMSEEELEDDDDEDLIFDLPEDKDVLDDHAEMPFPEVGTATNSGG